MACTRSDRFEGGAQGGRGRPGLPRGVRRRRMAATRRARPDAVGRGAREQVRHGAEVGQARELGWAEAKARRGVDVGLASVGGPEVRRRPSKGEKQFFKF